MTDLQQVAIMVVRGVVSAHPMLPSAHLAPLHSLYLHWTELASVCSILSFMLFLNFPPIQVIVIMSIVVLMLFCLLKIISKLELPFKASYWFASNKFSHS